MIIDILLPSTRFVTKTANKPVLNGKIAETLKVLCIDAVLEGPKACDKMFRVLRQLFNPLSTRTKRICQVTFLRLLLKKLKNSIEG